MNLTIGCIGVIGFLTYEFGFLIRNYRLQTKVGKILIGDLRYYLLIVAFSVLVFLVTSTFGLPDLSVNMFPPEWSNLKVFEALKAFTIGIATVHIYKTSGKSVTDAARSGTETLKLEGGDLTLAGVHRAWRRL